MSSTPDLAELCRAHGFPPEAIQFIREGLEHTVCSIYGDDRPEGEDRHVDGRQLCLGLRDYAIQQYGLLARTVLASWGIHRTDDFGRIVFALIDAGLMRKSDDDCFEHFQAVYAFDEVFTPPQHV